VEMFVFLKAGFFEGRFWNFGGFFFSCGLCSMVFVVFVFWVLR
jgi:hypothetical protein